MSSAEYAAAANVDILGFYSSGVAINNDFKINSTNFIKRNERYEAAAAAAAASAAESPMQRPPRVEGNGGYERNSSTAVAFNKN